MPILVLTDADYGHVVPLSGSADWIVYGTDAADAIELATETAVTFYGGAGTDAVHFLGDIEDYTIRLSGSSALFTCIETGQTVKIPITSAGDSLQFNDSESFILKSISTGSGTSVYLGTQIVTGTDASITADSSVVVSLYEGDITDSSLFDASMGSFKFIEDPYSENNVEITGFSSDDLIEVSNSQGVDYFFTNDGADVIVSLNINGGTVSLIKLTGVLEGKGDVILDGGYESFHDAVGFDAFSFV